MNLTVADYSSSCRELRMWGLWLAVVLAVASAAPQEVSNEMLDNEIVVTEENSSDETTGSGESVTTSDPNIGIVNETRFYVPTTTVADLHEENETNNELKTLNILDITEDSENVNSDPNSLLIPRDYPEELYLPDEDPIDNTIDDTLGSDDIIDVIKNFIAERDPMLQVSIS